MYSPLEQYVIIPFNYIGLGFLGFTFNSQMISIALALLLLFVLIYSLIKNRTYIFSLIIIPSFLQVYFNFFYIIILEMVLSSIAGPLSQKFFPFVFTVFMYILSINLFGLVPYCFTATSHIAFTLSISLAFFIAANVFSIKKLKWEWFNLFLPSGTPLNIAFLLVPLEFVLYFFRPFSLAIRLFCNMLAGHALLKIIVSFGWDLMLLPEPLSALSFVVPLFIIPLLVILELAVAFLQAYVFSILVCLYINDLLNAH